MKVLAINTGSTSTKIAFFEDESLLWEDTTRYDAKTLERYPRVADQADFRGQRLLETLCEHRTELSLIDAFVARGGLLRPMAGGTYAISRLMLEELGDARWGEHASNLAARLAFNLSQAYGKPSFIVDPVVVDELYDIARVTGVPELPRKSIFHALNQKAVARRAAAKRGGLPEDFNFIVCHLGGGVSVGAHARGRIVEVNDALGGEGPMSPERAGTVPGIQLADLCFSGKYSREEIRKLLVGQGGFVAHLGTNDFREVVRRVAEGDGKAKLVLDAFVYQLGKAVGSCAAVLRGRVDAVLVTGGLAHDNGLCAAIEGMTGWIAPIEVYPGEDEMSALAGGALRVLYGEEKAKEYL